MPDKFSIRIWLVGNLCTMPSSRRALGLIFLGSIVAASCGGGGDGGNGGNGGSTGTGSGGTVGSSGVAGNNAAGHGGTTGGGGAGGTTGQSGVSGSSGGATGTGGSATGTGGGAGESGSGGVTGTGGATAGAGGRGGAGAGGAGGNGGGTAGAGARGGGSAGNGTAGAGGRGGATGGTGGGSGGNGGGATSCAGHAVSLSANGTGQASDAAYAHVELNLGGDLPIGNAQRTVEFWAYIHSTDWLGEKNEVYYYGGASNTSGFGLDFGTDPVMNMPNNHATLNPVTGGGFNDDSKNDLGINSSTDQWVHIAMVWNGTNVITYVNGLPKITSSGGTVTALATTSSAVIIGCNPTNNSCFNGLFDELRIWSVARTATQIHDSYNKPLLGSETGLVGYWKFDETSGTTAADAATTSGHTAHNGTLKATAPAQPPTFVVPPAPLPLVCP
jgi:hypothetical protein